MQKIFIVFHLHCYFWVLVIIINVFIWNIMCGYLINFKVINFIWLNSDNKLYTINAGLVTERKLRNLFINSHFGSQSNNIVSLSSCIEGLVQEQIYVKESWIWRLLYHIVKWNYLSDKDWVLDCAFFADVFWKFHQ